MSQQRAFDFQSMQIQYAFQRQEETISYYTVGYLSIEIKARKSALQFSQFYFLTITVRDENRSAGSSSLILQYNRLPCHILFFHKLVENKLLLSYLLLNGSSYILHTTHLHIFCLKLVPSSGQLPFSIKNSVFLSFFFFFYLWKESKQNSLSFYFSVLNKGSCFYLAVRFFLKVLTSLPDLLEYGGMNIFSRIPAGVFLVPC